MGGGGGGCRCHILKIDQKIALFTRIILQSGYQTGNQSLVHSRGGGRRGGGRRGEGGGGREEWGGGGGKS